MSSTNGNVYIIDSNRSESPELEWNEELTARTVFNQLNPGQDISSRMVKVNSEDVDLDAPLPAGAYVSFSPLKVDGA